MKIEVLNHSEWVSDNGEKKCWTEYKITGIPTNPKWGTKEGWCRFTIYDQSNQLSTFGGELWPGAWPEIFETLPPTIYSGANVNIKDRSLLPA